MAVTIHQVVEDVVNAGLIRRTQTEKIIVLAYISAHPQVIQQKSVNYEFCLALSDVFCILPIYIKKLQ